MHDWGSDPLVSSERSPFRLSDSFIEQFKGKQPNWGPVGYVTYKRTYARRKDDGTYEEFWETCRRVVEGTYRIQQRHCNGLRLPWNARKAQKSAQEMFQRMWDFKWLPPGRGLWMMGVPNVEKIGGAALNNCAFVSTDRIKEDFAGPFCFLMDMSMLGVGVGGDTKGAGTVRIKHPVKSDHTHIVADTREGWVELVRVFLKAYVGEEQLPGNVDYSQVRPAGSPIRGFGGTASGPAPLQELVSTIPNILDPLIGKPITSTAIVDLFNVIGRCVVAGNVRRSAEILFGEPTDDEFLSLKDPEKNLEALRSHRWASNNSIFAFVGQDYSRVAEMTAKNGEPGYEWLDNARAYSRMDGKPDNRDSNAAGGNPCLEQTLESYELCCLVETFPANHDSYDDYRRTLKFAYLYAKTVTLVPTHDPRTNAVLLRNRRIGTSQSGIAQSITKHGRRRHFEWCDGGYRYLRDLDRQYSRWLCVPESIKITSVKPSGTVSLLAGATPGVHFPHSEFYIRNIRFEKGSRLAQVLEAAGYPTEDDVYTPNTVVISFPVHEKHFSRCKDEVSMWEQLEMVAQMQTYWADNQVSATVTFKPEEAKDIKNALELYETRLKGVSFLPADGGGYEQAPYIKIDRDTFERMSSALKPVDYSAVTHEVTDAFCDGDKCVIPAKK